MIRVLQYIGSLKQGGSQEMIMNIYRHIDKKLIQFDFVIHDGAITALAREAEKNGAKIYCCPQFKISNVIKYYKWWKDFFKEHQEYKVLHCHVRSTAAIVLRIAKRNGCVTIAHSHSTSSGHGVKALVKFFLQLQIRNSADYFMACSRKAGEWLFGKKVCESDRYFIVHNAIEVDKYIYDADTARRTKEKLELSPHDIIIGHVGRMSEPKNHSFIIDVFQKINKCDSRYKLLLVGDGELYDKIKGKINKCGLSEFVIMTGARTDVNQLMMAMDVFLFPSKWEGLPIALVEAQATGCPCIASDTVTAEVNVSDVIEFVSLDKSAEYWCETILNAPKTKRKNMSQLIIENGYDITETAKWMQNFYKKIID